MARARNLKPGFFKNEDLAECSPFARLCFAGLWTLADREGRLEDRPKRVKGELFAYDSVEVEPLLAELAKHGFILRYEVDGQALIQIVNFARHQNPHHRESPSVLPVPTVWTNPKPEADDRSQKAKAQGEPEASPGQALGSGAMEGGSSRAESLFSDSPFSDSLSTEAAASDAGRPKAGPAGQEIEQLFRVFYDAYPRKVGKDAARKAFAKRKPDEALVSVMVQAISRQRLAERCAAGEAQYVPHPSTWLNEGRWQDEDGPAAQSGKCPEWCSKAGFENVYEAGNAGCFAHNASEFYAGKRIAEEVQ